MHLIAVALAVTTAAAFAADGNWPGWRGPRNNGSTDAGSLADGKLYAVREDGVVFVASANGKFELLAENNLGERVIASPVPVANRLLLRGEKHLFCIAAK